MCTHQDSFIAFICVAVNKEESLCSFFPLSFTSTTLFPLHIFLYMPSQLFFMKATELCMELTISSLNKFQTKIWISNMKNYKINI